MTSVDKAQWIEVYRRLEKPLYNVVYRVLWDSAESQDVVQETFLRCWRHKDDIRAEGFKALLYRTALNLASNRRRRTRLWRMVGVAAIEDIADESAAAEPISNRRARSVRRPARRAETRRAADRNRGHDVS